MSTSVTMNLPKSAESRRTHDGTIDIVIVEGNVNIRVFLDDELAKTLIANMSVALATPAKDAA